MALAAEHKKLRELGCHILPAPTKKQVMTSLVSKQPSILYVLCHGEKNGTFHQSTARNGKEIHVSPMEYIPWCCQARCTIVLANCFAASIVTEGCRVDSTSSLDMRFNYDCKGGMNRAPVKVAPEQQCVIWAAAGPNQTASGIGFLNYLLGEQVCANRLNDGVIHEIRITYPADMGANDKPLASSRIVHQGEAVLNLYNTSRQNELEEEISALQLEEDIKSRHINTVLESVGLNF